MLFMVFLLFVVIKVNRGHCLIDTRLLHLHVELTNHEKTRKSLDITLW